MGSERRRLAGWPDGVLAAELSVTSSSGWFAGSAARTRAGPAGEDASDPSRGARTAQPL